MGLGETDVIDDCDGGAKSISSFNVSCSICLDPVTNNGHRSWAKLQCGHEFHLDCIGSAFNVKGAMQCPNCRMVEKGQWLFAAGCRSFPEFTFDDWAHDDDLYDLSYSEMSFGVQWCPFASFSRFASSFDEGEFPSTAYHDLLGQHSVFAEHAAVSSTSHPCPYVAYYGPIHSSSSNGSVTDGASFSNHWNAPSGAGEMMTSYAFAAMEPHFQSWERHLPPFSGTRLSSADQPTVSSVGPRSARTNPDVPRPGSFVQPFAVGHSGRSSVTSPMVLPYPAGAAARARDRVRALQAYFQQPSTPQPVRTPVIPGTPRFNTHRGPSQQLGPPPSSSNLHGGFCAFPSVTSGQNFLESQNRVANRFHAWESDHLASFSWSQTERDSGRGGFRHTAGGSRSFRPWHGSERSPSRNRP